MKEIENNGKALPIKTIKYEQQSEKLKEKNWYAIKMSSKGAASDSYCLRRRTKQRATNK